MEQSASAGRRGRPARSGGAAALLVVLFGSACTLLAPTDEARQDLVRAQQRWESLHLDDYTYLVRRACECLPDTTGPFEVRVRSGDEPVVIRPEDGQPVAPPVADAFPTVPGLFELVDDALRRGAYRLDVEYDRETGVPLRISVDFDEDMADDELLYWSTVPEPAG